MNHSKYLFKKVPSFKLSENAFGNSCVRALKSTSKFFCKGNTLSHSLSNIANSLRTYSTFSTLLQTSPKGIILSNQDGEQQIIHHIWLRDHCRCNKCIDPQTGQKFVRIDELASNPHSLEMKNVFISDDNTSLHVTWGDQHESTYSLKWLYMHSVPKIRKQLHQARKFNTWDKSQLSSIPTINYEEIVHYQTNETIDEGLFKWMKLLSEYGLCIVKDTPTNDTKKTRELVERISYVQNSIYGLDWEVIVDPGHVNVAYTSMELGIHMDLCYYESPPGFQFLHCFKQSEEGGENYVVDLFKVAEDLRVQNADAFKILTKSKISFHNGSLSSNHVYYRRALIDLDEETNDIQSIYFSPYWEAPFLIDQNEAEAFYNAFILWSKMIKDEKYVIEFKLTGGDLLSFNNRRVGHARRGFDHNSPRHLQGTYISTDEFANKYRRLRKALGKVEDPLKHLGNASHDLCIEELDYKL